MADPCQSGCPKNGGSHQDEISRFNRWTELAYLRENGWGGVWGESGNTASRVRWRHQTAASQLLCVNKCFWRIRGSVILNYESGSGRLCNYGADRMLHGHFCWPMNKSFKKCSLSLNFIKYWFFSDISLSLRKQLGSGSRRQNNYGPIGSGSTSLVLININNYCHLLGATSEPATVIIDIIQRTENTVKPSYNDQRIPWNLL